MFHIFILEIECCGRLGIRRVHLNRTNNKISVGMYADSMLQLILGIPGYSDSVPKSPAEFFVYNMPTSQ